jgi:hypothetical protein
MEWLASWYIRRTNLAGLGLFESNKFPDLGTHLRFQLCAISNHLQLPSVFAPFQGLFANPTPINSSIGAYCAYCGYPANSLDHLIPWARGGHHVAENLVPACTSCNSSKHTKYGSEFICALRASKRVLPPGNENLILRREQEYFDLYGNLSASDIRALKSKLDFVFNPPILQQTYRFNPTIEEILYIERFPELSNGDRLSSGELVIADSLPRPLHNFRINVQSVLTSRVANVSWASLEVVD